MKGNGSSTTEGRLQAVLGKTMEKAKESSRFTSGNVLGWLSLGLGITALVGGKRVLNWLGLRDRPVPLWTLRAIGAREVVTGLGILSQNQQPRWLWGRVAGDLIDAGLLGYTAGSTESVDARQRSQIGLSAVGAVAAIDVAAAFVASRGTRMFHVRESTTINRSPEEIYQFWREFENLPQFMKHLESVETRDGGRFSHWVVKAPIGTRVEWDAEIVDDVPNQLIAWRSLEGSVVSHSGVVRFEPSPHGTVVRVELDYRPPAGALGVALAKLTGKSADQQLESGLRHLKQLMDTGEIATTEGQPSGRIKSSTKYEIVG